MSNKNKGAVALGATLITVGAIAISKADIKRSQWECSKCNTLFTPTLGQYILGVHTIHRRMLKCPTCGNTSMCRQHLRKNLFEENE